MKKILFLFFIGINTPTVFSQIESNHQALLEKFKILSNTAESTDLHSGLLDSAICVQMLQLAQELKNDSLLAISYNLIGQFVSNHNGDNATALEYFFKAIPLAEKSNDKRRLSSIYFDMSLTYYTLQNYEESLHAVRNGGLNLPDKTHPLYDFMLAQYQRGLALYFVRTKQVDSALYYSQLLGLTSNKLKSPLFEASAMFLNGAAFDEKGDRELAETYFKKADALSDSLKTPSSALRLSANYIPFLLKNKELANARKQAQHILQLGEHLGNNDLKVAAAGFMRQVYDSLKNTDSAYFFSKMENTINAEIFNQDKLNKIQALAFTEQIRNMEEKAKEKQAGEQRHQNIQYALIALGIIVFITLFLLLSRSIIANERLIAFFAVLGLLVVFEFINLFIHPWLASFTHESPVLMLLTLVIIASLLIPLHHRFEHWIKERMIEKNKAIRLAAARKTIEKLEKKPGKD